MLASRSRSQDVFTVDVLGCAYTDNVYTGDLHMKNDRGDWTAIEEEDFLSLRNNKTGKRYKIMMEEIPEG